jgi:uncharacterized protein (DUF983 family)
MRVMHGEPLPQKKPVGVRRAARLIARGIRLRCPACGEGRIFRGWLQMRDCCPACGRPLQRGPGFFLGSIYFNYGVTAVLLLAVYFSLFFGEVLSDAQLLVLLCAIAIVFPIWFFRHARGLWIAFDELWDPWAQNNDPPRRE